MATLPNKPCTFSLAASMSPAVVVIVASYKYRCNRLFHGIPKLSVIRCSDVALRKKNNLRAVKLTRKVAFLPTMKGQSSSSSHPTRLDRMLRAEEPQSVKLVPKTKPQEAMITMSETEGCIVLE